VVAGIPGLLYAVEGGANRAESGRRSRMRNAAAQVKAVLERSWITNRLRIGNEVSACKQAMAQAAASAIQRK
jgi:hypothetical protein